MLSRYFLMDSKRGVFRIFEDEAAYHLALGAVPFVNIADSAVAMFRYRALNPASTREPGQLN